MNKLRIAGGTLNQTPIDWQTNQQNILKAIEQAKSNRVDILCLPELCITGYGCQDVFLSNWIYRKSLNQLEEICKHCNDITVAVGLPMMAEGRRYNVVALISNGDLQGFVAKQFLANDGVHYEPRWFTPWQRKKVIEVQFNGKPVPFGDIQFHLHGIKIGFEICEDAWRKDERPAYTFNDIDLILNPSASHFAFAKTHIREELIVPVSEQLGCTYLFANLLGNEAGRMIYDGDVLIARNGKLLAKNNRFSFEPVNLVFIDVDFSSPDQHHSLPITDSSERKEEFTAALTLALYDYLRKSKARGFVLSLSGGADSSTCAVLIAEMIHRGVKCLGTAAFLKSLNQPKLAEKINHYEAGQAVNAITRSLLFTAYQGTVNSSDHTYNAAKSLADSLNATFYNWTIDEEVKGYTQKIETVLDRKLEWETDDIALQNIQSRARTPAIWMLSNIKNFLLITTANRSEADVGYATMDGDTSGSIAPLGAIDKYFILRWLRWAKDELGYKGLELVNSLAPTAELRPANLHQTDEEDLMPYHVLFAIEREAIRNWKSPAEVLATLESEEGTGNREQLVIYIKRFFALWSRNQWKRERYAPSFHLDDFNVDPKTWCRFPILSEGFADELASL